MWVVDVWERVRRSRKERLASEGGSLRPVMRLEETGKKIWRNANIWVTPETVRNSDRWFALLSLSSADIPSPQL